MLSCSWAHPTNRDAPKKALATPMIFRNECRDRCITGVWRHPACHRHAGTCNATRMYVVSVAREPMSARLLKGRLWGLAVLILPAMSNATKTTMQRRPRTRLMLAGPNQYSRHQSEAETASRLQTRRAIPDTAKKYEGQRQTLEERRAHT